MLHQIFQGCYNCMDFNSCIIRFWLKYNILNFSMIKNKKNYRETFLTIMNTKHTRQFVIIKYNMSQSQFIYLQRKWDQISYKDITKNQKANPFMEWNTDSIITTQHQIISKNIKQFEGYSCASRGGSSWGAGRVRSRVW